MELKERMLKILVDNNISKYQNDKGIIREVADMISHFNEDEKKKLQARYAEDQERTFLSYKQYYYDEGLEKGREEGAEQRNIAIAKSMLEEKMDLNLISKITGLSVEQIKNIVSE